MRDRSAELFGYVTIRTKEFRKEKRGLNNNFETSFP